MHLQIVEGAPYRLLFTKADMRALGRAALRALTNNAEFIIPGDVSAVGQTALQVMHALHAPAPALPRW